MQPLTTQSIIAALAITLMHAHTQARQLQPDEACCNDKEIYTTKLPKLSLQDVPSSMHGAFGAHLHKHDLKVIGNNEAIRIASAETKDLCCDYGVKYSAKNEKHTWSVDIHYGKKETHIINPFSDGDIAKVEQYVTLTFSGMATAEHNQDCTVANIKKTSIGTVTGNWTHEAKIATTAPWTWEYDSGYSAASWKPKPIIYTINKQVTEDTLATDLEFTSNEGGGQVFITFKRPATIDQNGTVSPETSVPATFSV